MVGGSAYAGGAIALRDCGWSDILNTLRHLQLQPRNHAGRSLTRNPTEQEFESLVIPHLDFFLGLAMQLTRDRDQAQDLVQESVLKAYRSFASFRPHSNFRAWVARILTNTFLTENERARRRDWGTDPDEMPDPRIESQSQEELAGSVRKLEEIPGDAFSDEVMGALHELPGDMALAVYLADVEELTYVEIGEILGVPIGTVRSRISRGRQHLQRRLLDLARDMGITGKDKS